MRLDDLPAGWETLESGVAFIVDKASEGNAERGILDTVDHYIPNPFVEGAFYWSPYDPVRVVNADP